MKTNKKDEQKSQEIQNYLKLSLIFVVTALTVFGAVNMYHGYLRQKENNPVIRGTFEEVTTNELENFLQEHDNTIIYFTNAKSLSARTFEETLIELVADKEFKNAIVAVDLTFVDNYLAYLNDFNYKYSEVLKVKDVPAFVVFESGLVVDILQAQENEPIRASQFNNFMEKYHDQFVMEVNE